MASVGHDRGIRCWAPLANQLHALQGSDRSRATSSITGSKPPQEGMQAWNERRRSHGPPSQNLCPPGAPSKDRTDITRGTLQALRHIKARGFYQTSTPYGFHSIPLGRNVHSWPFSYPPIPISAPTSLLTRFALPGPFHVHSMSASSMCGPALLPHHHDRRA
jgi:hypothetical protein